MVVLSALLFIGGCANFGGYRYYTDDAGNITPRNPRFKLKGELSNYEGDWLIDTNAIYLEIRTDIYAGSNHFDTLFHFKRFFSNGQYFGSEPYERMPTKEDFSNLNKGTIGYYTFKDEEIWVETFARTPGYFYAGGDYFFSKHKVVNDKLIKYKEKVRCWNCGWYNVNLIYEKIEVEDLGGTPDW